MQIVKIDGGRYGFDQWSNDPKIETKGIRHHLRFFGYLLSHNWIQRAFKDPDVGYLNKTSVVAYLKRNVTRFEGDGIAKQIQGLTDKSRVADVAEIFFTIKKMQAVPPQDDEPPLKLDDELLLDQDPAEDQKPVEVSNAPPQDDELHSEPDTDITNKPFSQSDREFLEDNFPNFSNE